MASSVAESALNIYAASLWVKHLDGFVRWLVPTEESDMVQKLLFTLLLTLVIILIVRVIRYFMALKQEQEQHARLV